MRTNRNGRAPRATYVVAGALTLALPTTAIALASGAVAALGATSGPALQASLARRSVAFGSRVTVRGTAPASDAGRSVELEFAPAGSNGWHSLGHGRIGSGGHFTLHARLKRSGRLRTVSVTPAAATDAATAASTTPNGGAGPAPSQPQTVAVRADFQVAVRSYTVPAGHRISVRGQLAPAQRDRVVRLMTHGAHGWTTLASTRTGRRGGFDLRYAMPGTGTHWLRVSFRGDRDNRGSWAHAGSVTGMVDRVASWYEDGGSTACGFHAYDGVANRTLPCGTQVEFAYAGRTVTATVDDRGPYVGGRDYDLNQNVADALGMHAVATVLASK